MDDVDFDFYLLLWLYGSVIMIMSVVLFQITGLFIFSVLAVIGALINLFAYKGLKDELEVCYYKGE